MLFYLQISDKIIMKELKQLCRENIWNLAPYSCARNEFSGRTARVFLDAI